MALCPSLPADPPGSRYSFSLLGGSGAEPPEKGLQLGFVGRSEPRAPSGSARVPWPVLELPQLPPAEAAPPGRDKHPRGLPQLQEELSWSCQGVSTQGRVDL